MVAQNVKYDIYFKMLSLSGGFILTNKNINKSKAKCIRSQHRILVGYGKPAYYSITGKDSFTAIMAIKKLQGSG